MPDPAVSDLSELSSEKQAQSTNVTSSISSQSVMPANSDMGGSIKRTAEQVLMGVEEPKARKVTRIRTALACQPCKIAKAKCSDNLPCSRCVRKNEISACVLPIREQSLSEDELWKVKEDVDDESPAILRMQRAELPAVESDSGQFFHPTNLRQDLHSHPAATHTAAHTAAAIADASHRLMQSRWMQAAAARVPGAAADALRLLRAGGLHSDEMLAGNLIQQLQTEGMLASRLHQLSARPGFATDVSAAAPASAAAIAQLQADHMLLASLGLGSGSPTVGMTVLSNQLPTSTSFQSLQQMISAGGLALPGEGIGRLTSMSAMPHLVPSMAGGLLSDRRMVSATPGQSIAAAPQFYPEEGRGLGYMNAPGHVILSPHSAGAGRLDWPHHGQMLLQQGMQSLPPAMRPPGPSTTEVMRNAAAGFQFRAPVESHGHFFGGAAMLPQGDPAPDLANPNRFDTSRHSNARQS